MLAAALLIATWFAQSAGPASVQEPTHIEQMNRASDAARATDTRQISPSRSARLSAGETVAPDRTVEGSATGRQASSTLDQLTAERLNAQAGAQLTAEEASAGPAPSTRERASGRVTLVARPDGPDRCDPQGARRQSVVCDRVIEARAGEFSTPDFQPLSPEQRLLATQRQERPAASDAGSAARRLANGEIDESTAALAVASLALRPAPNNDREKDESTADTSAIDAIVAGITTLITGAPPNP